MMRRVPVILILALLSATTACVERRLTIRSDPPGVVVTLAGRRLEHPTPITVPLEHHGAYRVELEYVPTDPSGPAYRRHVRTVVTDAPWYDSFPFDLFAEVLWPGTLRSETEVSVNLEPLPADGPAEEELDRLQEEADAARGRLGEDE